MENITNQVIVLGSGQKYYIIRQALFKGNTYYLAARVTDDENDFTNEVTFLEKNTKDGQDYVKVVSDKDTLQVLFNNVTLDDE